MELDERKKKILHAIIQNYMAVSYTHLTLPTKQVV